MVRNSLRACQLCVVKTLATFKLAFGCGFSTQIPHLHLSVNLLEAARGEILLWP